MEFLLSDHYAWSDSQRQILGYVFVVTFLIKVYFVEEKRVC